MELEKYIKRGREIVDEVEALAKQTPLPIAKLEALSEEWRGALPTIIDLAKDRPVEQRLEIENFFMDVSSVIDLPLLAADIEERKGRGKK